MIWQHCARLAFAGILALSLIVPQGTLTATAANDERSLYLYYTHTGETARITFKRNGQYLQTGLRQLNQFLRDWRRNEPANMDPALFDLLWEVYRDVGAEQPIHIVSAYRSPATNEMLRSRSSGVAENSQHTRGKAMDFFIPGVELSTLRAVAMRHQVGGVGYYPTSGSPFVHLDTGNVRAWPRMTRTQLANVFPDGRTLHLPADGRPLSEEGRRYAEAEWNRCRSVPCNGDPGARTLVASGSNNAPVAVATLEAPVPMPRPAVLGGGAEVTQVASLEAPALPFSTTGSVPLEPGELSAEAPTPATMSPSLLQVARARAPSGMQDTAISAIAALEAPEPASRVLMSDPTLVAAYAPIEQDPEARRALDMLIARETANMPDAEPAPQPRVLNPNAIRTASLGPAPELAAAASLFEATWSEVSNAGIDLEAARALENLTRAELLPAAATAEVEFIAPDLDHIPETFFDAVPLSSARYGILFEAEGSIEPRAELGKYVARIGFEPDEYVGNTHLRFSPDAPLISSGI